MLGPQLLLSTVHLSRLAYMKPFSRSLHPVAFVQATLAPHQMSRSDSLLALPV